MAFIKAEKLKHKFVRRDEQGEIEDVTLALDDVNIEVEEGQFIAVLGHNGSGKSTFAKHLNALLTPSEGTVWVDGKDTSKEENILDIRKEAGMIFQNPDNQIVAGVVEEDVPLVRKISVFRRRKSGSVSERAWSSRHDSISLSFPKPSVRRTEAACGDCRCRGDGAKCIIMDEPTAMLDPNGRKEVLNTVHRLNRQKGVTVILITHYMEEVIDADYVFVMDDGHVVMQGMPRDIFSQVDTLLEYGLDVPQITRLAWELKQEGLPLPDGILSRQELVEAICQLKSKT